MNRNGISPSALSQALRRSKPSRGFLFGLLILGALIAFEIFNYSTTDFALSDLLGSLRFAGLRWSTILAIAFCGIDFAGIARLFTPEKGSGETKEVWYLFGAWLLAASMNAMLTWWGVALAILSHTSLGQSVLAPGVMLKVVPIFVAIMVWLIRVLIIGTLSVSGGRLFSQASETRPLRQPAGAGTFRPAAPPISNPVPAASFRSASKLEPDAQPGFSRPEPSYHPVSLSSANPGQHLVRR